jgi:hypothetical protein
MKFLKFLIGLLIKLAGAIEMKKAKAKRGEK